jgi:hypothetical protein
MKSDASGGGRDIFGASEIVRAKYRVIIGDGSDTEIFSDHWTLNELIYESRATSNPRAKLSYLMDPTLWSGTRRELKDSVVMAMWIRLQSGSVVLMVLCGKRLWV